ncbi:lactate dehydrogenase [Reticulibacter mediterranei]|uniref:Lactate dehydrogenase n=1 Tax=Reticulibacter mediterranei TaxID=2778369 RepID=A0A8J3MZZ7_9CHLR|nr:FAD-binding oxidoreductase [Reticulibacter mediterranei]GHO93669.1 lactate dehydrogenase [Reticulibacter mediterranei]
MLKETARRSLMALLPKGQVFVDRSALLAYEADAGIDKGIPEGVVFPRHADDVAHIMRWAAKHAVPLVARGAGTGLSGGAVADRGGVVVDFARMNGILDFDVPGRSVLVQPALINLRLDERAREDNLYFPPDPSSQRASTIGGNVAENSGGPHCFKYGVTTNYVTGLDVVLADGHKMRVGGRALDYPEYDLCGLITGSEGMLALITSIAVRLRRNPPGVRTMLAIFDTPEQAGEAVSAVIAAGLVPATMEMMDQKITRMIEPYAQAGLPLDAGAILIIEVDGYPESLDRQIDEIAQILRKHAVREMRFAHNEEERYRIWLARKSMAGGITRLAPAYYTVDITVPRSRLTEMLVEVDAICEQQNIRTGHVMHAGDGNLHPMLLIPEPDNPDLMRRILTAGREIVQCCIEKGGSLTGEHGVGIEKREYMSLMHNPIELMAMWDVKQAFDPHNLLNPGKVFPPPEKGEDGPFAGYSSHANGSAVSEIAPQGETFVPASLEEAAQGLLALTQEDRCVVISNAQRSVGDAVRMSAEALRGVSTYAPDDMYIIIGAGTPLQEVQEFLAQDGRQLALASPWPEATIGGLIAANVNAPLRMRYGALRDLVLSTQVALADGRVIRTGRPIVKNVAGYDLSKALIGSHGTLGFIGEVALKVVVKPRTRRTLLVPVDDLRHGLIWARQVLPLALVASGIVLCKGYWGANIPTNLHESAYVLAYTAEGLTEDVLAELEQVRQALHVLGCPDPVEVDDLGATDIWTELLSSTAGSLQVRVGVPARELPAYIQDQSVTLDAGSFLADLSSGFVYAVQQPETFEEAQQALKALRAPALRLEGYAVVMDAPGEMADKLDRWGYTPQGIDVMKALKRRWDSRGILVSPERFLQS